MRLLSITFFITLLFSQSLFAQAKFGDDDTIISEIQEITKDFYKGNPKNAVLIGVIQNGQDYVFPLGSVSSNAENPPSECDIFELGSVSEIFTMTLLAQLQQEGFMNVDEAVDRYVPENVKIPYFDNMVCTAAMSYKGEENEILFLPKICFTDPTYHPKSMLLCDLATHTSGLPSEPMGLRFWNKKSKQNLDLKSLYKFVGKQRIPYETGKVYNHSTIGVALLGACIENAFEDNFNSILKEKVCFPLNLRATTAHISSYKTHLLLEGHDLKGKEVAFMPTKAMAPALGITSTMEDMMRFLRANLGIDYSSLTPALLEAHSPRLEITNKEKKEKMCLGWHSKILKTTADDQEMLWISGGNEGFHTYIGFLKNDNSGIVIMSNSALNTDQLGEKILQHMIITNNAFARK